jgi:hypothetical protein
MFEEPASHKKLGIANRNMAVKAARVVLVVARGLRIRAE